MKEDDKGLKNYLTKMHTQQRYPSNPLISIQRKNMIKFPEKIKIDTLALSDPLTKETEVKRTHAMFAACAAILLTVYGLKINKTPWLDIEIPSGAPNILHGALSVGVVYTILVYLAHMWTDYTRWWIARETIQFQGYEDTLRGIHNHLDGMKHLLSESNRYESYTEDQQLEATRSQRDASAHLAGLLVELRQLQKRHTTLTVTQYLRLVLVDVGIPLTLAFIAFAKIGGSIVPFLAAITM